MEDKIFENEALENCVKGLREKLSSKKEQIADMQLIIDKLQKTIDVENLQVIFLQ